MILGEAHRTRAELRCAVVDVVLLLSSSCGIKGELCQVNARSMWKDEECWLWYGWVVWPQVIIHMPVAPWHRHLGLPRSPWSAMVKWSSSPWLSWCLVMWPWADFFTVRWATICKSINLLTETCQIPEKHCHKAESSSLALKIGFNIYFKQLFQRRSSLLATAGWGFSCGVATSSQRIASSWRPQLRDSPKK